MEVQFVWLQLLAQLQHLIDETEGPDARRAFRSLGPSRCATARRQLRLQQSRLIFEANQLGMLIDAHALAKAVRGLPDHDDLGAEYLSLASSFSMVTETALQRGNTRLATWLAQRAHLHVEHSLFLAG